MIEDDLKFLKENNVWVSVFPYQNPCTKENGWANDVCFHTDSDCILMRNMLYSSAHLIRVYSSPEEAWIKGMEEVRNNLALRGQRFEIINDLQNEN